jgi:hypothetical protein
MTDYWFKRDIEKEIVFLFFKAIRMKSFKIE